MELTPGPRRGFSLALRTPDDEPDPLAAQSAEGGGRMPTPLTNQEVKNILARELEDALGGLGSQTAEERRTAQRMYYGRPLGNEMPDRSQVVMLDVLETIENAMPSLMKMFTGGTEIARFKAKRADQTENAELATAYLNHVFLQEMDGEEILYDWFKTALLEKNGIVKVYWEERVVPKVDTYKGLTEDELTFMLQDPDVTALSVVERDDIVNDPEVGPVPIPVYDVDVRVMRNDNRIRIDGVPPEEFVLSRRTIHLDDETTFSAHRKKQTVSNLVAMGIPFEVVADMPSDDSPEWTQGRTERLNEDEIYPVTASDRMDAASRELWTTECYARIDEDGDGYSELRRILIVGDDAAHILADDEINSNPFVSITPIRMPHKFIGQSLADLVVDLQVINTTLLRQIMDHLYLSVNPRLAIVEGMVEIDDLLTVRPGGLIRQRSPGNIEPIKLPDLPPEAFQAMEYLRQVRHDRTGVMSHGGELDASAINTTATGMNVMAEEKAQKLELIARIFAVGIKKMFRKMLRAMVENDTKERQVRLSGKWVTINPSTWDADMDLDVEVGLGVGKAAARVGNLTQIMAVQEKLVTAGMMGYLVTPENLYASATELCEAAGFKDKGRFFSDPAGKPPPEPPPDPDMKKLELEALKAQSEAQLAAGTMQLNTQKQLDLQAFRVMEIESRERVEMARIESMERNALGTQEATVESSTISADATRDSARISAAARTSESQPSETNESETQEE